MKYKPTDLPRCPLCNRTVYASNKSMHGVELSRWHINCRGNPNFLGVTHFLSVTGFTQKEVEKRWRKLAG